MSVSSMCCGVVMNQATCTYILDVKHNLCHIKNFSTQTLRTKMIRWI